MKIFVPKVYKNGKRGSILTINAYKFFFNYNCMLTLFLLLNY